ncbi:cell wall surface anchor family protein [Alteromonas phage PB15]|nr:cell wall surface anchor family protein [Alteromonas phage PB15]
MALVPHKFTALAESDAEGTDGKNIIAGAVVSLYDPDGNAATLFDDENYGNGSTAKQTDAKGQVVVYVEQGEYDEEVNGSIRRRVLIGSKSNDIISYGTTAEIEALRPNQTGSRIENRERANAQYVLREEGYVAQAGDITAANGRVWALKVSNIICSEWFGGGFDAIQNAANIASIIGAKVYTSTDVDFAGATLSIPSGVKVIGVSKPSWTNAKVSASGATGAPVSFTGAAIKGDKQITLSSASGLSEGGWLKVISATNSNSQDAGDLQLGDRTSNNSQLSEFVQVQSISGSVVTLHEPLLWNYPITASTDTPSGISTSFAVPVDFHSNGLLEGVKISGNFADYLFEASFAKDFILKDCYIDAANAGAVQWLYCYNSGAKGGTYRNTQWGVDTNAQTIPFKFLSCQECYINGKAEVVGGQQGIDITYEVGDTTYYGGPSISCRVENNVTKAQPTDGITSHPGCYNTMILNNVVYAEGNGIRIRSRADVVRGNTCYGSSTSINGILADSLFLEGSVIEGNTLINFISGITQADNSDPLVADNANQVIVKGNTTIGCGYGFSCNFSNPTSLLTNTVVQGNLWVGNSERNLIRGVTLGKYSNGLTIKDNTSINATEAGVRYSANIINLTIKDNECLNLAPAGYGVRGASSSSFITDLTTFPDGESSANLSIRNNSQMGGIDYTGIVRNGDCYRLPSPTGYQGFSVPISDRGLPALQLQTMNLYLDNSTSPPELRAKVNNGTSVFDVLITQLT